MWTSNRPQHVYLQKINTHAVLPTVTPEKHYTVCVLGVRTPQGVATSEQSRNIKHHRKV